ncbi:hypothetical protein F3Y22_tig00111769pilonHSYRG00194 [Hibiscus syriacus]|uniref:Uncharacterized protein n=1 Tax=Hibiscus syriacus TaxID=106335 RepID=A0A6A2YFV7_HIBSY|nr:hypothetical protein F3Y22_tig00111769pilonHSYRG00194 [Hibiscus syriacus]
MEIGLRSSMTFKSSSVASRHETRPVFLPLQYMVHKGSSKSLVFSFPAVRFSHSRAILTMPELSSFCNALVCMANSRTNEGRHLGLSWIERVTLPLRYPKRVSITRVPELVTWVSDCKPVGQTRNVREGVRMGKERKTERKARKTRHFCLLPNFNADGSMREKGCCGGDGGDEGDLGEEGGFNGITTDEPSLELALLVRESAINGR